MDEFSATVLRKSTARMEKGSGSGVLDFPVERASGTFITKRFAMREEKRGGLDFIDYPDQVRIP
jgi:hypothetical protein